MLGLGLGLTQPIASGTGASSGGDDPVEQKIKTSDTTSTDDTNLTDAAGLGLSVAANRNYAARWVLIFTTAAATTGLELGVNGPASPTELGITVRIQSSSTANQQGVVTAYDTTVDALAATAGVNNFAVIEMSIRNGTNAGTIIPRFRTEIAASEVAIKSGSFGQIWEVV